MTAGAFMFFRFSDGFGATWGGERTEDEARAEARREAARLELPVTAEETDEHGFVIENGVRFTVSPPEKTISIRYS